MKPGTRHSALDTRPAAPPPERRFALFARFIPFALSALSACSSPEASRTRAGGAGADVGNRAEPVEFHAGARPYYDSRCATLPVPCQGPLPVFGPTSGRD